MLAVGIALFATSNVTLGLAQTADGPDAESGSNIIVKGHRMSRAKRIGTFVKTLTPVHMTDQIGRFTRPVCPAMIGLTPGEAEQVQNRFRDVAKAAGATVSNWPCAANVLIIAVANKRKFIESMPRYAPDAIDGIKAERLKALATAPGPVSAWQVTTMLDQNGEEAPTSPDEGETQANPVTVVTSNDASRLVKATQKGVTKAVVVIEKKALAKMSTRQVADYAAMRALAPVDPLSARHALSGNPASQLPANSILGLFDAGTTPETSAPSVTWWDYAFLRALYAMEMSRAATLQRSEIQSRMAKILAKVPAEEL